jgi:hypothetical protein
MRKILIGAVAGAALAVVPAMAAKPATQPTHPTHPPHPAKCKTNTVGFHSKGTLTAPATLVQSAGQGTTDTSDDRYDGSVTVNVTSANHGAPKGSQTYSFTGAKVSFYDVNGTPVTTPAVGDTVHVFGKITKFRKKHCGAPGSPTITVKRVSFTQAAPTS